jgi:hypothetical protein
VTEIFTSAVWARVGGMPVYKYQIEIIEEEVDQRSVFVLLT